MEEGANAIRDRVHRAVFAILPVAGMSKSIVTVVRRNGQLHLPGGKSEPEETTKRTLVRELQEELSLDVKQADFRLVLEQIMDYGSEGLWHEFYYEYLGEVDLAKLVAKEGEIHGVGSLDCACPIRGLETAGMSYVLRTAQHWATLQVGTCRREQ